MCYMLGGSSVDLGVILRFWVLCRVLRLKLRCKYRWLLALSGCWCTLFACLGWCCFVFVLV